MTTFRYIDVTRFAASPQYMEVVGMGQGNITWHLLDESRLYGKFAKDFHG